MEYDTSAVRKRYFNTARRLVDKHPEMDEHRILMVAVGFVGSKVVGYGFNKEKTDPIMKRIAKKYGIRSMYKDYYKPYLSNCQHAEVNCLKNCDRVPEAVIVLRRRADDSVAEARPCEVCHKVLMESGVKTVYYTTETRVQELRLQ